MRIIKDNTAQRVTCTKCKSILEVSQKDISSSWGEYAGESYTYNYFFCPCCGHQNGINNENN